MDANEISRLSEAPAPTQLSMVHADQAEQALRQARAELAYVTRVTNPGELTASFAHEVNQPLAAVVANVEACLRWLNRETPDLAAARAR